MKRRRLLRRAAPPPPPCDPGRALLERAAALGLMSPAEVERVDRWAGELASRLCAGEVSADELDAMIASRVRADLARRGKA